MHEVDNAKITDEELREVLATGEIRPTRIRELADEVLHWRQAGRIDSRRAEQVKRLRWVVENLLTKLEQLASKVDGETRADVARQAEDMCRG